MLNDKDGQSKLINMISQTIITSIDDIPVDVEPNRIKEKKESLKNTLENRLNIPMSNSLKQKTEKEDIKNLYSIVDFNFEQIKEGKVKPINVKEEMLENMREYGIAKKNDEAKTKNIVIPAKVEIASENSIESLINRINKYKEEIDSKKKKVQEEEKEIEATSKTIYELNIEYNETETRLREYEDKNTKLEQELILKLNRKIDSLNNELAEVNRISNEMSMKQSENNAKIVEFRKRIDFTKEKISMIDGNINEKKQILELLNENKIDINSEQQSPEYEIVKRVA